MNVKQYSRIKLPDEAWNRRWMKEKENEIKREIIFTSQFES